MTAPLLRPPTRAALRPCATAGCPGLTRAARYCERCADPSTRPLAACARPSCPRTTRERLCDAHAAEAATRPRGQRGEDARPSAARRGYDAMWRKLRAHVLRRRPWCQLCRRARSREVDHIVPRRMGGTEEERNLMALCRPCHSRKTVHLDGGFGRARAQRGGA